MAQANSGWFRGTVKAVPSGDSLVIMGSCTKDGIPPERTIVLAHLSSPKLARRDIKEEPFAWESREFLRNLCVGQVIVFKTEYTITMKNLSREFCSVFFENTNINISREVVFHGWARVKAPKGEATSQHGELLSLEEQAKRKGVGLWDKTPGAREAAIRKLPPSALGDQSNFDAKALLASNQFKTMEAIVEQVRDGSTLRVYLLPDFQFVQVYVAGVQAPSMGRRKPITQTPPEQDTNSEKVTASTTSNEVSPDPYGMEAKHFTEIRVLNRDVWIVLQGVDKYSNLIASVYYPDGDSEKDLALELIENGFAKYAGWKADMMENEARRNLKAAELQAKKNKLRVWKNGVPPPTNTTTNANAKAFPEKLTGRVVEVVSGDCIIVADDSAPFGSPSAERRVNLSSIECPKLGNPRRHEQPAPYAYEAREILRKTLIGREVQVSIEYSREVPADEGYTGTRVMRFGSVFLKSEVNSQLPGVNVAELVIANGFGTVIKHIDSEERSNHYKNLLAAESRANSGKKGIHSSKEPQVMNVIDLFSAPVKKVKDFLPSLQANGEIQAVVEYIASGHRFKLFVPQETCNIYIAFSFAGVRCPGREDRYSKEAMSLVRRRIMHRDVKIKVETVDSTGTFLGSLCDSKSNVAIMLLESGLARLTDNIRDAPLLAKAQQFAKEQKLKIWENYVEGEEVTEFNAIVTEVLSGGKFYVQAAADRKVAADIENQLASLNLEEGPVIGTFNPKKGDLVIAQFRADNSWNRAMIVNTPRRAVQSLKAKFEVFYIDYGSQEVVTYNQLRPMDKSVSSAPGIAQLCSLAYLKVPTSTEDCGQDAIEILSEATVNRTKEFRVVIEDRDRSGGKVTGQGTGNSLMVSLIDGESGDNVSHIMLKEGVARLEKRWRWDPKWKQELLDELEEYQAEACQQQLGMWRNGDVDSNDDKKPLPYAKKLGGGKH